MRISDHEEFVVVSQNPIYKFWKNNDKPFLSALIKFYECLDFECVSRKIKTERIDWIKKIIISETDLKFSKRKPYLPTRMTTGYRIILLSKNEKYYKKFFAKTSIKRRKDIDKLISSEERFKYAKILGIT